MAIGAAITAGMGIFKKVGGFIKNRVSSGKGVLSRVLKDRVKPDGFLAKVAPNMFGAGGTMRTQAKGDTTAPGDGKNFTNGDLHQPNQPDDTNGGNKNKMFMIIGGVVLGIGAIVGTILGLRKRGNSKGSRRK